MFHLQYSRNILSTKHFQYAAMHLTYVRARKRRLLTFNSSWCNDIASSSERFSAPVSGSEMSLRIAQHYDCSTNAGICCCCWCPKDNDIISGKLKYLHHAAAATISFCGKIECREQGRPAFRNSRVNRNRFGKVGGQGAVQSPGVCAGVNNIFPTSLL